MTQPTDGDGPATHKADTQPRSATTGPRISRWPVVVTVCGLGLAGVLVYVGARLAAAPAPRPDLSHPGTPDHPRDVTVIMRDYAFNPTPLYLVAGETVRFHVLDAGMLEHEFVLGDDTVQQAWEQADAAATPPSLLASAPPASVPADVGGIRLLLNPGQQQDVVYTVPTADQLELVCHLPGHAEHGMVGSVILATP